MTRPEGKSDDLCRRLEALAASVVDEPLTRTVPLSDAEAAPLDQALRSIDGYDWVLFTSDEGVRYCLQRAAERHHTAGLDSLLPETARIAVIGPRTADAVRAAGRSPDVVATDHRAEGLVQAIKSLGEAVAGRRFLLVRAEKGRDVLPSDLTAAGGAVTVVTAYRTEAVPGGAARAAALIAGGGIDVILATSGAALDELAAALASPAGAMTQAEVVALGPVTAEHARKLGFRVALTATSATIDSLIEALVARYGKEN